MSTPISSKKNLFTTGTPHPSPVLQCSINSSPESSHASIIDEKTEKELTAIPHHLKSKAAGANALKKAARILAVGLFTVEERCSCTVSGSSNKSKQDNKRPQFDIDRMSLIHGKWITSITFQNCFLLILGELDKPEVKYSSPQAIKQDFHCTLKVLKYI